MAHFHINDELAVAFRQMALLYKYKGNDERFRAISYERAARVVEDTTIDLSTIHDIKQLPKLRGIGKGISEKIAEYVNTGRINTLESLKKETPVQLIELLNIRGFGPKSIKVMHETLGITTKSELKEALDSGTLKKLKGFGAKKIQAMQNGLSVYIETEHRILLWDALKIGDVVVNWMKKCSGIQKIELAGSLRRQQETIGDIDVLVCCEPTDATKIVKHFTNPNFASSVLSKGDKKASIILLAFNKQIDLLLVNENEWGSALSYFTGSREHTIAIRTAAQKNNIKVSEYGILNLKDHSTILCKTEEDFYHQLGYDYIPPEMRENKGELELAQTGKLPTLIEIDDIKGDLQMHSTYSDGLYTIEEIVNHILANFNYEYIVITDHSKSAAIAGGIDEYELLNQIEEINRINQKLGRNFIKTGIEVDILKNGNLDFSDEILCRLDWVTASIHNGFKGDNTERLIKACQNKYVDCIGHPTGRLIGKRDPYTIRFDELFKTVAPLGIAFEINAQANRMDLNDVNTILARENKIPLVISTDSHHLGEFYTMNIGVGIARRAWCEKKHILNTRSWEKIEEWRSKRKGIKIQKAVLGSHSITKSFM